MSFPSRAGRSAPALLLVATLALAVGLALWLSLSVGSGPGGEASGLERAGRPLPATAQRAAPEPGGLRPAARADRAPGDEPMREGSGSEGRIAAAEAPAGPRRFAGQVLARGSGRPLDGARVKLVHGRTERHATTDADGRFALEWDATGTPSLEVRAEGFVPARLPSVAGRMAQLGPAPGGEGGAELEPLILRLLEGAVIEGVVVGPPATGAGAPSVRLHPRIGREGAGNEIARSEVDARGAFRFEELAAGEYLVAAEAPERTLSVATVGVGVGERAHVLLELARAGRLSGLVLDGRERPIAGVRVRLETQRQGLDSSVLAASRREALTGDDGRFLLVGLSAGTNSVELTTPWEERRRESIVLARAGAEVERTFRLQLPASLTGRVVDSRGEPVGGAHVELSFGRRMPQLLEGGERGAPGREGASIRTRADGQGRFRFEDLPAGQAAALVAVPPDDGDGRLAVEVGFQLAPGENRQGIELMLGQGLRLAGSVRMRDGGPLVGARVELAPRLPGRMRVGSLRTDTDHEGRFVFDSLPPAPYRLTARHADARQGSEPLELESSLEDVLLELEGSLSLSGIVLDDHGLAVPSAWVMAMRVETGGRDRRGARTDAYGRFELRELEAGLFELTPMAGGHTALGGPLLVRVPEEDDVLLEMRRDPPPPRAGVRGQVQIAGTREPPVGFEVRRVRGGLLSYDDGRFLLEGLTPGEHLLELAAEGCVPRIVGPLELAPGATMDLGRLELEPGTLLRVDVRDNQGVPVRRARVVLRPLPVADGGRAGTETLRLVERSRGRYEAMVPRGAWRLTAGAPGLRDASRRIEVLTREVQRVELELAPLAQ